MTNNSQRLSRGDFDFGHNTDRRFAFSRQSSFHQNAAVSPYSPLPQLTRSVSSIDIPPESVKDSRSYSDGKVLFVSLVFGVWKSGNKQIRRLFLLIWLNVAYSGTELVVGLHTGRIVSDEYHLTFGCDLLSFSLYAMAASRQKPDRTYIYRYKRLEVLSAFTDALFLLFMSFSSAVEALHAFIQDESEHKFNIDLDESRVLQATVVHASSSSINKSPASEEIVTVKELEAKSANLVNNVENSWMTWQWRNGLM